MTTLIDSLGSQVTCSSSRESIMYQSTVFPQSLPLAMSLISSTILQPKLTSTELETQKDAAAYEVREIWQKPELILPEILHSVAFKDNTLGMPLLCPESQLDVLGEKEVRGFMRDWYKPERMVVAGVGMQHEELVELAQKEFGSMVSTSPTASTSTLHQTGTTASQPSGSKHFATVSNVGSNEFAELAGARATYTGGEEYIEKPDEEFVHLYVGFEGLGIHDPDIVCPILMYMLTADE
jgi:processing peptidase subunit alpha